VVVCGLNFFFLGFSLEVVGVVSGVLARESREGEQGNFQV